MLAKKYNGFKMPRARMTGILLGSIKSLIRKKPYRLGGDVTDYLKRYFLKKDEEEAREESEEIPRGGFNTEDDPDIFNQLIDEEYKLSTEDYIFSYLRNLDRDSELKCLLESLERGHTKNGELPRIIMLEAVIRENLSSLRGKESLINKYEHRKLWKKISEESQRTMIQTLS